MFELLGRSVVLDFVRRIILTDIYDLRSRDGAFSYYSAGGVLLSFLLVLFVGVRIGSAFDECSIGAILQTNCGEVWVAVAKIYLGFSIVYSILALISILYFKMIYDQAIREMLEHSFSILVASYLTMALIGQSDSGSILRQISSIGSSPVLGAALEKFLLALFATVLLTIVSLGLSRRISPRKWGRGWAKLGGVYVLVVAGVSYAPFPGHA